jgi:hypothetical protein
MNCKNLEELLSAYADGELPRTQKEFIEEHLRSCADCRETLAGFVAAGRQLSSLKEMPAVTDIKGATLYRIKRDNIPAGNTLRRGLRPALAIGAAIIIIAVLLAVQPWDFNTPAAAAAAIVRGSPEVQAFFSDEQIENVEVTTTVIGSEGDVLVVLVKTETKTAAAEVDLKKKIVTDIVRVQVPALTLADEEKAIGLALTDARVQELIAKGGIIGKVTLDHAVNIQTVAGPGGNMVKEGTVDIVGEVQIESGGKKWYATVDVAQGKVIGLARESAATMVADWSETIFSFLNPALLLLGVLIITGLVLKNRPAEAAAGIASIVIGVLALYGGLYAWPAGQGNQIIALLAPALGVIIGITDIRRRNSGKWIPVIGSAICALAFAWQSFNIITYPEVKTGAFIAVALAAVGAVAYALYDQIKKIPWKWLRPAVVAAVAVVALILALLQPWGGSLEPQSVMAKTYTAIEGLQSYRMSFSSTSIMDEEVVSNVTEIEFAAPNRYHTLVTNNGETSEYIIIGDTQYMTKGSSHSVAIAIASGASSSIMSKENTLKLLDELAGLKTMPDEKVNGVSCYHYLGKWDKEKHIAELKRNMQESYAQLDMPGPTDEQMEEIYAELRSMDVTYEYWIGKDDYLIRKMKTEQRGPSGERGKMSVDATMNYYDFNRPIDIEPPLDADGNLMAGWQLGAVLGSNQQIFSKSIMTSTGPQEGYNDWEHQEVRYTITLTNTDDETVTDVRVTIATKLTKKDDKPMVVAEPDTPADAVGPGESRTFRANIPFDATGYTKEEILELEGLTTILVDYTTAEGRMQTQLIYTDPTYPTKTPPPAPPAEEK